MIRSISVFGLGYVGTVTAACLARAGHSVVGVDINPAKVEMLEAGRAPVLEPGLDEIVAKNRKARRLRATTDPVAAVNRSEISFLCVGTPSLQNGGLDLSILERTCQQVGLALRSKEQFHLVVVRSTVLPGTMKSLVIPAIEAGSGKRVGVAFAVCANPEFTREGSAVADFMNPEIIVLGAEDRSHLVWLRELYDELPGRIFETSLEVAEMVKYVSNAFHALKVSFANEIGSLCDQLQVDSRAVTQIFTSDTRLNISPAYLTPGFAFGGSCLPKDLRALSHCAKQRDVELPLLRSILPSNQAHLKRAVEAVLATRRKKIAVLGLSFKAGTDDLRESPSVQLIKRLLGEGCQIQIWDRDVSLGRLIGSNRHFIEEEIPHIGMLLSTDLQAVIKGADLVVIGTKAVDESLVRATLQPHQLLIDLREGHFYSVAGRAIQDNADGTEEVLGVMPADGLLYDAA